MTEDKRYTVAVQVYVGTQQVDYENVYIYAPDFDTALPYLDLLISKAWATLRQNQISVEAPQTYETNVKREEDDSNN